MRELFSPIVARACKDAHAVLREARQHAVAVVLHLVDPATAAWRFGDERGELRLDERGQLRRFHAFRLLLRDVASAARLLVVALDEQPVLVAGAREEPASPQLRA